MSDLRKVKRIARQKKRHAAWRKVVTCVAALVVFCTTYALILPAITMEKSDYTCGLTEHTHTADCYQLTCGRTEIFSHTHGADCYDAAGNLTCPYPEQTLHHHSADCYRDSLPHCGTEASEGHTHGDSCYAEDGSLICGLEESTGHTHTDSCYIAPEALCGQPDVTEHRHTSSCYTRICELEEHTHDESCVSTHQGFLLNLGALQGNIDRVDEMNASTEPVTEPTAADATNPTEAPTDGTEPTADAPATTEPTNVPDTTEAPTSAPTVETDVTAPTGETQPEQDLAAMVFSLRSTAQEGAPGELDDVIVSNSFKITTQNVVYKDNYYSMDMALEFKFNTDGATGSSYITDGTGNAGLHFTKNLGDIKLPDGFKCDINKPGILKDGDVGKGIFYFEKTDAGLILHVVMDESYVKQAGTTGIPAKLSFKGSMDKEYGKTDGSVIYPNDDEIWISVDDEDVTYPENESNLGDISVSKNGSFSYNDDGTLSYTVYVSSKNGTGGGEITFKDTIDLGNLKVNGNPTVTVKDSSSNPVNVSSTYSYNEGTISMTLPALAANGNYTVTYTYKLDKDSKENLPITNGKKVNNTAQVEATPKNGDDPGKKIKDESEKELTLTKPEKDVNVRKTGNFNYTSSATVASTLTYTVEVWSTNGSPGVIELTDVLELVGLDATPGDITVEHYKKGETTPIPSTVSKKTEENAKGYTYTSSGEGGTGNKTISYTLPELGVGEKYVITYTYTLDDSSVIPSVATGNAKNTVTVKSKDEDKPGDEGKESSSTSTLDVQKPHPALSKENDWTGADANGQYADKITWTITVNSNHVNIVGEKLTDELWRTETDSSGTRTETSQENPNPLIKVGNDGYSYEWVDSLEISVKEADAAEYTKLVREDFDSHLTINEDGTISFKAQNGTNTNSYKLVYKTHNSILGNWGYNSYENRVEFFGQKAYSKAEEYGKGDVVKEAGDVTQLSNGDLKIDWTITITLCEDSIHDGSALYDTCTDQWGNGDKHYIDRNSLKVKYDFRDDTKEQDTSGHYYVNWYKDKPNDDQYPGNQAGENDDVTYMQLHFTGKQPTDAKAGDKLIITYSTYAKKDEIKNDNIFKNYTTYRNEHDYADKTFKKDSIVKTDGQGNTADTTVENLTGEMTWKIKATIGSLTTDVKTLNIMDTLPVHLDVTSVTVKDPSGKTTELALARTDKGYDLSGKTDELIYDGKLELGQSESSNASNITVKREDGKALSPEFWVEVTLNCKVYEEYLENTVKKNLDPDGKYIESFTNEAYGFFDQNKITGNRQTQTWTYEKESEYKNSISKSGTFNGNDQVLSYSLTLNPEGKDLDPANAMVTIIDEFKYKPHQTAWFGEFNDNVDLDIQFDLVPGSVKLYSATKAADGSVTKGSELDTSKWSYIATVDDPTGDFENADVTNILKLSVPDGTPLILEYQYRLTCNNEQIVDKEFTIGKVTNRAYFQSEPDKSGTQNETQVFWDLPDATGSVSIIRNLTIYKVDGEDASVTLAGAKFKIHPYVYDKETGEGKWSDTPVTRNVLTGDGGYTPATGDDATIFTTDENGKIVLGHYSFATQYNTLYKLVEFEAPEGYTLDKDNPPTVYFYFSNEKNEDSDGNPITSLYEDLQSALEKSGATGAIDLAKASTSVTIKNYSNLAKFSVIKQWYGSDGNKTTAPDSASTGVGFKLWQKTSLTEGDTTVSNPLADTVTVKVTYGSNSENLMETFTVPRGSVVNLKFTTTSDQGGGSNGVQYKALNLSYYKWKSLVSSESDITGGIVETVSFTANYNIHVNWTPWTGKTNQVFDVSYTVTSPNTGNSGTTQENTTTGNAGVTFKDEVVGEFVLNSSNNWTWNSENLPKSGTVRIGEDGEIVTEGGTEVTVYYTYYVTELDSGDKWNVSYSNQSSDGTFTAISSGTITVTNTLPPPPSYLETGITVKKNWDDTGLSDDFDSVYFHLIRKEWDHNPAGTDLAQPNDITYSDADNPTYSSPYSYVDTIEVKKAGDGTWTWNSKTDAPDLELISSHNGKYYTYFLLEEPNSAFDVTYSGQAVDGGTITVTNKVVRKDTELVVEKEWYDYFDKNLLDAPNQLPQDYQKQITFKVYQIDTVYPDADASASGDGSSSSTTEGYCTGTLYPEDNADTGIVAWYWSKSGLPAVEIKEDGTHYYSYYVVEDVAEETDPGFTIKYKVGSDGTWEEDPKKAEASEDAEMSITIRNTLKSPEYELPSTGGAGTGAFYLFGTLLTLAAATLLISKKRTTY